MGDMAHDSTLALQHKVFDDDFVTSDITLALKKLTLPGEFTANLERSAIDPSVITPSTVLTFGIEIEFVVGTMPERREHLIPEAPRPHIQPKLSPEDGLFYETPALSRAMVDLLVSHGFPTVYYLDVLERDMHKTWVVGTDALDQPDSEDFDWHQIEVSSPAFRFGDEALEEVEVICRLITETYRTESETLTHAGLHCHVGNSLYGFHVSSVRKILAALWTFEDQLESIVATTRLELDVCERLREFSSIAFHLRDAGLDNLELATAGLQIILETAREPTCTVNTLLEMLTEERSVRLGYNFRNLYQPFAPDFSKRTIEFRHHESTLNGRRVAEYARFCVGLVKGISLMPFGDLGELLHASVGLHPVDEFTVIDVLKAFGMKESADYYEKFMADNPYR